MKRLLSGYFLTYLIASGLLSGCDDKASPPPEAPLTTTAAPDGTPLSNSQQEALQHFKDQALSQANVLNSCVMQLNILTDQYLNPSKTSKKNSLPTLSELRKQFNVCRNQYHLLSSQAGLTATHQQELESLYNQLGNLLAFPGYIDSVVDYPHSGIVNDTGLVLNEQNLRHQHELTDSSEVSIGFDVIEFLLWGEHRFDDSLPTRPNSDFTKVLIWENSRTDLPVSEHSNNRRRRLLQLVLSILQEDVNALEQTWSAVKIPKEQHFGQQWQLRRLQTFLTSLKRYPNNTILRTHIFNQLVTQNTQPDQRNANTPNTSKLTAGELPESKVLVQWLQQRINHLPTVPPSLEKTMP